MVSNIQGSSLHLNPDKFDILLLLASISFGFKSFCFLLKDSTRFSSGCFKCLKSNEAQSSLLAYPF